MLPPASGEVCRMREFVYTHTHTHNVALKTTGQGYLGCWCLIWAKRDSGPGQLVHRVQENIGN
jgi:hypothetical protein